MLVEHGLSEALETMRQNRLMSEMTAFRSAIEMQHNTKDAAMSRPITVIRWVVERANGRIKKWKSLYGPIPNSHLPYFGDYVRIVAALCNAYGPDFVTSKPGGDEEMAERMLALAKKAWRWGDGWEDARSCKESLEMRRWLRGCWLLQRKPGWGDGWKDARSCKESLEMRRWLRVRSCEESMEMMRWLKGCSLLQKKPRDEEMAERMLALATKAWG